MNRTVSTSAWQSASSSVATLRSPLPSLRPPSTKNGLTNDCTRVKVKCGEKVSEISTEIVGTTLGASKTWWGLSIYRGGHKADSRPGRYQTLFCNSTPLESFRNGLSPFWLPSGCGCFICRIYEIVRFYHLRSCVLVYRYEKSYRNLGVSQNSGATADQPVSP